MDRHQCGAFRRLQDQNCSGHCALTNANAKSGVYSWLDERTLGTPVTRPFLRIHAPLLLTMACGVPFLAFDCALPGLFMMHFFVCTDCTDGLCASSWRKAQVEVSSCCKASELSCCEALCSCLLARPCCRIKKSHGAVPLSNVGFGILWLNQAIEM